jgi:hypothetical protein
LQHLGQGSSCFIFLLTRRIAILMSWCGNISEKIRSFFQKPSLSIRRVNVGLFMD